VTATCHPISAGGATNYLLGQVFAQDAGVGKRELHDYMARTGNPEGVWVGKAAAREGAVGVVTPAQMTPLFDRCCHPVTGEQLGRRMAVYQPEPRTDRHGEVHVITRQARTGFDVTFSPPKSVSVMWALTDDVKVRDGLRDIHEEAWRHAFGWLQETAASTRTGAGGHVQKDVDGLMAASFQHWFSRSGDMQLHTHVAISNMVRTSDDGKWRRLDSEAWYAHIPAANEIYVGQVIDLIGDRLGWSFDFKLGRGGVLLPEIAGVPAELIDRFSQRAGQVNANLKVLEAEYFEAHGKAPDSAMRAQLAQIAVLGTREDLQSRPGSAQHTWEDQQPVWHGAAADVLACRPGGVGPKLAELVAAERHVGPMGLSDRDAQTVAARMVYRVQSTSATWTTAQMSRCAGQVLREGNIAEVLAAEADGGEPVAWDGGWKVDEGSIARVVEAAKSGPLLMSLSAPPPVSMTIDRHRRRGGTAVHDRVGQDVWTSRELWEAEENLSRLAALQHLPRQERIRRRGAVFGELTDDVIVRRQAVAAGTVSRLDGEIESGRARLADLQKQAAAARAGAAEIRRKAPTVTAVELRRLAENAAAARLVDVDDLLGRGRLRGPSAAERAALTAERGQILARFPNAQQPAEYRARRWDAESAAAAKTDAGAATMFDERADQADGDARRVGAGLAVAVAHRAEQIEGRDGLAAEIDARMTGDRIPVAARHLDGLDGEQRAAMIGWCDRSRPLIPTAGPAGTGKSRMCDKFAEACRDAGIDMRVVAAIGRAATDLGAELGVPSDTIQKQLRRWEIGEERWPAKGSVVFWEEASTCDTLLAEQLVVACEEHGLLVRGTGDGDQLDAVGPGGAFKRIVEASGTAELTVLHRFTHAWEADATRRWRAGDPSVLADYQAHGRVFAAPAADMVEKTYQDWRASPASYVEKLMIVNDNRIMRELSERARGDRIADGEVERGGVMLRDDQVAGRGDVIVTRRIDRRLKTWDPQTRAKTGGHVENGSRWEVVDRHGDGALEVRHLARGTLATLPAWYVAEHVDLGYTCTIHGSIGQTVDDSVYLRRAGDDRRQGYTAMTRGRNSNIINMCQPEAPEEDFAGDPEPTVEEMWAAMMARSNPVTAHEVQAAELAASVNLSRLVSIYEQTRADELRDRLAPVFDTLIPPGAVIVGSADDADVQIGSWQQHPGHQNWGQVVGVSDSTMNLRFIDPETGHAKVDTVPLPEPPDPAEPVAMLDRPDAWRIMQAALAAEARGLDAPKVVAGHPADAVDVDKTVKHLRQAVNDVSWGGASGVPWPDRPGGLVCAPGPQVTPEDGAWLELLGGRINERRAALVAELADGPQPAWTTALGERPTDPAKAAAWAKCAGQVAAWRESQGLTDASASILGPKIPTGKPESMAYRQAASAVEAAKEITGVTPPSHDRLHPTLTDPNLYPQPQRGIERGGPEIGF
jgi:conjugative relaxase-like TrwC/TraI family protein